MPTYQFLLHTTDLSLDMGDGEAPAVGFYTSRRAYAANADEAFSIVMAEMDADPELEDIFSSAHEAGRQPRTVAEETFLIPWWKAILPRKKPGLVFYPEDPPEDDGEPSPIS